MRRNALKSLCDAVLVACFLALAAGLVLELHDPWEVVTEAGAPADTATAAGGPPAAPPQAKVLAIAIPDLRAPEGLGSYRRIVNRPLFTETRRPPLPKPREIPQQVAAPAPIKPPIKTGQFRLVGVMIEADTQVALMRDLTSKELVRVREGESVSGWTVESIAPRSVSLRQDDVVDTMLLRDNALTDGERQALERNARAAPAPDARNAPGAPPAPVRNPGRGPGRVGTAVKAPEPPSGANSRVPSQRQKSLVR